MKKLFFYSAVALFAVATASCSLSRRIMQEPNTRLNLTLDNFEMSKQVTGEATVVRILWIDWVRLFAGYAEGYLGKPQYKRSFENITIPVLSHSITNINGTGQSYAMHDMMQKNPGYDVVLYPQIETKATCPILGMCGLFSHTKVKSTARLGKLKN